MAKLAKYEDTEDERKALIIDILNMSRRYILDSLFDYCNNRSCVMCAFAKENCNFEKMDDAELKDAYNRMIEQ